MEYSPGNINVKKFQYWSAMAICNINYLPKEKSLSCFVFQLMVYDKWPYVVRGLIFVNHLFGEANIS